MIFAAFRKRPAAGRPRPCETIARSRVALAIDAHLGPTQGDTFDRFDLLETRVRRAVRRARPRRRAAVGGTVVSEQVGAHDRRLRARRLDRQAGARARPAHGRAARPDGRDREPAWCRRQHCRRAGHERAARRLHRLPRHRQQPGHQSASVFEAQVRPDQELRADRSRRQVPAVAGRRAAAAGEHGAGAGRLRARQSRQGVLRVVGQRVAGASGRRDLSPVDRNRRPPRALQGRRPGDDGHDGQRASSASRPSRARSATRAAAS